MGGGTPSRPYCRPYVGPPHLLIAHRSNDPAEGPALLEQGARGLELDVFAQGSTWYVGHNPLHPSQTVRDYVAQLQRWPQSPDLLYLDIKTPRSTPLVTLYDETQRVLPEVRVIFSTARDAQSLLALPRDARLCVDYADQDAAQTLFALHHRRFWMSDGIAAGLRKEHKVLATPWPWLAEGKLGWTYADFETWQTDVVQEQLDASIVTRTLLPRAAAALRQFCAST